MLPREGKTSLSGSPREKNEDITMLHVFNAAADVMSLSRPRPTIESTTAAADADV